MTVQDHNVAELETWRDGVRTQMRTSALTSAHQLCIFEQWCDAEGVDLSTWDCYS